jgi:hypothetical protein
MKWVRKHVKLGARLALLAFAVQFVLSFGHFHPVTAQAAPTINNLAPAQADLVVTAGAAALDAASQFAKKRPPPNQDNNRSKPDGCAICAVIALANTLLFATPPVLLVPQAVDLVYLSPAAEFANLKSAGTAFQPRAPPTS